MAEPVTMLVGSSGLNNLLDYSELSDDNTSVPLSKCLNVVVNSDGSVQRCLGKTPYLAGSGYHSLHAIEDSLVYCKDNVLQSPYGSITLSTPAKVSYTKVQNKVFYSNGTDVGYISADGIVPNPIGEYHGPATTKHLLREIKPGYPIKYAINRLFSVEGNSVYHSNQFNPLVFNLSDNRFTYKTAPRMITAFEDGLWLSDGDGIYYIRYRNGMWKQDLKANYPALAGEASLVIASEMPIENIYGVGHLVATVKGICLLTNDGIFINLTDKKLRLQNSAGKDLKLTQFAGVVRNGKYYVHCYGQDSIGLVVTLSNLAVTQQDVYALNSIVRVGDSYYGSDYEGIHELFVKQPVVNSFSFKFDIKRTGRIRYLRVHGTFYGAVTCTLVINDSTSITYTGVPKNTAGEWGVIKIPVQRLNGIGTYCEVTISSAANEFIKVNEVEATLIYNRRIY